VHDDFLGYANIRGKVKRPHVLQSSLFRALGRNAEGEDTPYDAAYQTGSWTTLRFPYKPGDDQVIEPDPRQDLNSQGEPIFGVHPPSGLPDTSDVWGRGTGRHLAQINMMLRYANLGHYTTAARYQWDQIPNTTVAERNVLAEKLAEILLPGGISPSTKAAADAHVVELYNADLRDAALNVEVAALLLASPEFLLH
jgi:hypothetical protein